MKKFLALISCGSSKKPSQSKDCTKSNSQSFEASKNDSSLNIQPFRTPQLKPSKFISDDFSNRKVAFFPTAQKGSNQSNKKTAFENAIKEGPESIELSIIIHELILLPFNERRAVEISLLNTIRGFKCKTQHLISSEWMNKYLAYLRNESQEFPPEIDNSPYLSGILTQDQKLCRIDSYTWNFLAVLYGGGPAIPDFDRLGERREFNMLTRSRPSTKAFLESSNFSMAKDLQELEHLQDRKRKAAIEKKFYDEHFTLKTDIQFIVDKAWMSEYRSYMKGERECPVMGNCQEEILQSIANRDFLDRYELVNDYVWQFITRIHKVPETLASRKVSSSNNSINFEKVDEAMKEIVSQDMLTAAKILIIPAKFSNQVQSMFQLETSSH